MTLPRTTFVCRLDTGCLPPKSADRYALIMGLVGPTLAAHRTGEVIRSDTSPWGFPVVRKTYTYPRMRDRLRGAFRNTFAAASRARRELQNLDHLTRLGLNPDLAVACGEQRRLGVLHHSFLVTRWWPSRSLESLLGDSREPDRELLMRVGAWVASWHGRGYVDRDCHLRNLLVNPARQLAKIDCPRGSFVGPARARTLGRRDREALRRELRERGLPAIALECFDAGYAGLPAPPWGS